MKAIVVLGGELESGVPIPHADVVVAVDSGWLHARELELRVDILVGDFDSLSESEVATADRVGVRIVRYPSEKDWTDFELALREVIKIGVSEVDVIAGTGKRIDHMIGNISVLAHSDLRHMRRRMLTKDSTITLIEDEDLTILGRPGDLVTLQPIGGPVDSVRTAGLLYPLTDEPLSQFAGRGISNEMKEPSAIVSAHGGVLAIIHTKNPSPPTSLS